MKKGLTGKRFVLVVHKKAGRKELPILCPNRVSSPVCPPPSVIRMYGLSEAQLWNWVSRWVNPVNLLSS